MRISDAEDAPSLVANQRPLSPIEDRKMGLSNVGTRSIREFHAPEQACAGNIDRKISSGRTEHDVIERDIQEQCTRPINPQCPASEPRQIPRRQTRGRGGRITACVHLPVATH
jgi:hypothetical protein